MHLCPGKWVATGLAVVCYARTANAFSAGIKCRHCTYKCQVMFDVSKTIDNISQRDNLSKVFRNQKKNSRHKFDIYLHMFVRQMIAIESNNIYICSKGK